MSSILNDFFPELSNKNQSNSDNKSEILQGREDDLIKNYSTIPSDISKSDVLKVSKINGELESKNELYKLWSDQTLDIQKSALSALDLRIKHSKSSQQNELEYNKKMSQHCKNILSSRLNNEVVKTNFDGYQSVVNQASETISL
jgi:hypothetical protein